MENYNKVKQIIIIRKDLHCRRGKMIAQGAHASMKIFFDLMKYDFKTCCYTLRLNKPMIEWMEGLFTKIVVGVDSEEELLEIYNKAKEKDLPCVLITDAGLTEFHGTPTNTAVAIGPGWSDEIDSITGHLSLL
jgi:PTH2 family peptidyl-tRNA hydrolase